MIKGSIVLISPELTNENYWEKGEVIEVKENSFIGLVIAAKTSDGRIFFGRIDMFKSQDQVTC